MLSEKDPGKDRAQLPLLREGKLKLRLKKDWLMTTQLAASKIKTRTSIHKDLYNMLDRAEAPPGRFRKQSPENGERNLFHLEAAKRKRKHVKGLQGVGRILMGLEKGYPKPGESECKRHKEKPRAVRL